MSNILFKYREKDGKNFLSDIKKLNACFICTIAHTETSSIPGISAAGATTDLIKYTPAADVEAIFYGKAKCLPAIPENPLGPPSPVIISIASLELLKIPFFPVNAGVKIKPFAPLIELNETYGKNIESLKALEHINMELVIEKTEAFAKEISKSFQFVILGESVPGGTTTAMALINSFGFNCFNKICGSMPGNQHNLKSRIIKNILKSLPDNLTPLEVVKKIGDPMQPIQAFLAIELAKRDVKVFLAGGTQMVAVELLIEKLNIDENIFKNIAIGTTKWVSEDSFSNITGLMKELNIKVPLLSANLDFSISRYKNLQLYEQGYVKEGVGAGALAVTVLNNLNISKKDFLEHIENTYKNIYKKK